jgi:hypothetical protein
MSVTPQPPFQSATGLSPLADQNTTICFAGGAFWEAGQQCL